MVAASSIESSQNSNNKPQYSLIAQFESNGLDSISGFGAGITFIDPDSHIGFGINSTMGHGEVLSTDGYLEDYFKWEEDLYRIPAHRFLAINRGENLGLLKFKITLPTERCCFSGR